MIDGEEGEGTDLEISALVQSVSERAERQE